MTVKDIVKQEDESQGAFEAKIRRRIAWSGLLGYGLEVVACALVIYGLPRLTYSTLIISTVPFTLGVYLIEKVCRPAVSQLRHERRTPKSA